jgi:hypothetical protein
MDRRRAAWGGERDGEALDEVLGAAGLASGVIDSTALPRMRNPVPNHNEHRERSARSPGQRAEPGCAHDAEGPLAWPQGEDGTSVLTFLNEPGGRVPV